MDDVIDSESGPQASPAWVKNLERRSPALTGMIGRIPSRAETRRWTRKSEKRKAELVARKIKYLASGLKEDMIHYLLLRKECGYIEGVPVPAWLMGAGQEPRRGVRKKSVADDEA